MCLCISIVFYVVHACAQSLNHVQLFMTSVAHQAPLSMRFPRQEHLSGSPFPSPGDLPNPGIELASTPATLAFSRGFFTAEPPGKSFYAVALSQ